MTHAQLSFRTLAAIGALGVLLASSLGAQGTTSAQSFGYPTGQLSTRAEGTAGALGDIDARSPINPASLAIRATPSIYAQYDPELRTVTGPGGTSTSTTSRFPNFGAVLPVNGHLVFGVSASALLDRTWQTTNPTHLQLGLDTVTANERLESEGGITDLRFAAAYAFNSRIRVGVGFHGYSGSMRVTASDVFTDTLTYRTITQVADLRFGGNAVSAGLEVDVLPQLGIALSGRRGGGITMYANDTTLSSGKVPDEYSGSISFSGLPGTIVAARASHTRWSELNPLATTGGQAMDANDYSVGVESAGPRVGNFPILIRLGGRQRTLPFLVGTSQVKETSYGGGLGIPIAFNRVVFDMSVLRANRTGVPGISEHAYDLSFGLQVHP